MNGENPEESQINYENQKVKLVGLLDLRSISKNISIYHSNQLEKEEFKNISFTKTTKIKLIDINLIIVYDFCIENYETCLRKMNNKGRQILCLWTGKLSILKMYFFTN